MRAWILAAALALFPVAAGFAQVLSEQQIAYIVDQVLQDLDATLDGTILAPRSLPPDRLSAPVPADFLVEEDPGATILANAAAQSAATAAAAAATAQSAADSAAAAASAAQGDANTLDTRLSGLEAKETTWDAAAVQAAAYAASPGAVNGFTTNLVMPSSLGYTVTLYFAEGSLTNAVWEETP